MKGTTRIFNKLTLRLSAKVRTALRYLLLSFGYKGSVARQMERIQVR